MKDSYSLDRDEAGLQKQYIDHYNAYFRIGVRAGLPLVAVGSDTGMMGGKVAHEFMYVAPIGEDTLVLCDKCGYSANHEVARFVKIPFDGGKPAPLEKVATPNAETIADIAKLLGVDPKQTLKCVFFMGNYGKDQPGKLIIAAVRGDMEVNQTQVTNLAKANSTRPPHPEEITAAGLIAGYASPIGIKRDKVMVIVDDLVPNATNLVAGANEKEFHVKNSNCGRDYTPDVIGHIALATESAPCQKCQAPLRLARGVEVGNIFQLGTRYSVPMNALFNDEAGQRKPIIMGSYGIGVGRLLACVAEEHRDKDGLALPVSIAPYHVALVALARKPEAQQAAEKLYADLLQAGVEVLYDDRDGSPGVKFAEADLRGMPLRLTIGERSLQNGGVEMKHRRAKDATIVPLDKVVATVQAEIRTLQEQLTKAADNAPRWKEPTAG